VQQGWALVAVVVTAETTNLLNTRLMLGAVIIAAKTPDWRNARQWLGAVIVTTHGLITFGDAPRQAENLAPVDRVGRRGGKQAEQGRQCDDSSFHDNIILRETWDIAVVLLEVLS